MAAGFFPLGRHSIVGRRPRSDRIGSRIGVMTPRRKNGDIMSLLVFWLRLGDAIKIVDSKNW